MKYKFILAIQLPLVPFLANAAPQRMPKEAWLARFKPAEVQWHYTDAKSPIKQDFKESTAECTDKVSKILVQCTTTVKHVNIPNVLASRQQATKIGSIVGECIGAYYFGGDHLRLFNLAQSRT